MSQYLFSYVYMYIYIYILYIWIYIYMYIFVSEPPCFFPVSFRPKKKYFGPKNRSMQTSPTLRWQWHGSCSSMAAFATKKTHRKTEESEAIWGSTSYHNQNSDWKANIGINLSVIQNKQIISCKIVVLLSKLWRFRKPQATWRWFCEGSGCVRDNDSKLCIPGTPMTSIFEGQPTKTKPKLQSKQGAPFGF